MAELTPPTTMPLARWQIWLRRFGLVALILLVCYQLSQLLWMVIAPEPLILKSPTQAKGQSSAVTAGQVKIADAHLFGKVSEVVAAPVKKQVKAPETRLRLELHGVNRASDDAQSSAIIARKGARGEFYRIGDTIQGRTKLAEVYGDRVILDTAGRFEALYFEDAKKKNSGISAADPASTSRRPARTAPRPSRIASTAGSDIRDRILAVSSVEEFVSVLGDEAEQDPQGLLNSLGLSSQGAGSGYRVANNSLLLNVGLRLGDKIISINGQSLGDVSSDQLLLADVISSGQASIVVERNGKRLTLNQNFGSKE